DGNEVGDRGAARLAHAQRVLGAFAIDVVCGIRKGERGRGAIDRFEICLGGGGRTHKDQRPKRRRDSASHGCPLQGRYGPAPDFVITFGRFYDFWLYSRPAATMPVTASCVNAATATEDFAA